VKEDKTMKAEKISTPTLENVTTDTAKTAGGLRIKTNVSAGAPPEPRPCSSFVY
jgi:hypothetical protein